MENSVVEPQKLTLGVAASFSVRQLSTFPRRRNLGGFEFIRAHNSTVYDRQKEEKNGMNRTELNKDGQNMGGKLQNEWHLPLNRQNLKTMCKAEEDSHKRQQHTPLPVHVNSSRRCYRGKRRTTAPQG